MTLKLKDIKMKLYNNEMPLKNMRVKLHKNKIT